MHIFLFVFSIVSNIILGASLSSLWWLFKIRKIQKKTRVMLDEVDVLLEEQRTLLDTDDLEKIKAESKGDLLSEKMTIVGARIEVTGEFFK